MSRTERVTFERGLLESTSDSIPGFSAGVSNMDIEKGVAIRRMGTRCLNNPDVAIDIALIHSAIISGCPVCFIISKKREVFAALDQYPERLMRVFKRGFAPLRNEQRETADKWLFAFRRGAKFFALEDGLKLRFINEHGDTFTINKRGYMQVFYGLPTLTNITLPTQLINARRDDYTDIYLALEIEDTTHNMVSKFNIVDDPMKQNIPLKGQVAVAMVNNEGVIGPLSDPPHILADYKHAYITLVEAKSLRGKFDCLGPAFSAEPDFSGAYVERVASVDSGSTSNGPHDMVEEGYAISQTAPTQGNVTGSVVQKTVMIAQDTDGKCYMWFDHQSLVATPANAPDIVSNGILASSPIILDGPINYLNTASDLGGAASPFVLTDAMIPLGFLPQTFMKIVGVQYNVDIPLNYAWSGATRLLTDVGGAGDKYTGQIFLVDLKADVLGALLLKETPNAFRVGTVPGAFVPMYNSGIVMNLFRAKIKMWQSSAGKLHFLQVKMKYNLPGGFGYACRNKGFDCWEIDQVNNPLDSATITDMDETNYEIALSSPYDLFCPVPFPDERNEFQEKLLNGRRFAVWNDKRIIAKSQMAYRDDLTGAIIYDVSE